MRGRGRKTGNPMSRNYESNGPDVKIRGNASHIAEKYSNLARDALSNGDTVMAENYYQHAEHYNRIVAAAQQNNPNPQQANRGDDNRAVNGRGPQPEIEGVPAEVALGENAQAEAGAEATGKEGGEATGEAKANARPRRNTRGRPQPKSDGEDAKEAEAESSVEAAPEVVSAPDGDGEEVKPRPRGRRPRDRKDADMSDDAAKLPQGLTAPVAGEESAAATAEE